MHSLWNGVPPSVASYAKLGVHGSYWVVLVRGHFLVWTRLAMLCYIIVCPLLGGCPLVECPSFDLVILL